MNRLPALLVGTMALGLAATPSEEQGIYIQGNAGVVIPNNPTTDFTFPPTIIRNVTVTSLVGGPVGLDPSFKAKMDVGFGVSVSAGYEGLFIPEFRVEGEINYHSNQIDTVTSSFLPSPHSFGATGSIDSIGLMVNGYYDFLNSSAWTPYLGGGIGAAQLAVSDAGIPALSSFTASDHNWQFAYQGIAGVRYSFTPSISASLDYR